MPKESVPEPPDRASGDLRRRRRDKAVARADTTGASPHGPPVLSLYVTGALTRTPEASSSKLAVAAPDLSLPGQPSPGHDDSRTLTGRFGDRVGADSGVDDPPGRLPYSFLVPRPREYARRPCPMSAMWMASRCRPARALAARLAPWDWCATLHPAPQNTPPGRGGKASGRILL